MVTNLLAEQHADMFVEQVQDIVQQLKEHPERLPIVSSQPTDGVSYSAECCQSCDVA